MKKALLLLTWLLLSLPVLAQYKLKGRVVEDKTNEPLEAVSVFINTTTKGTLTNKKGEFSLNLPAGRYDVVVSYLGYEPIVYQVNTEQLPPSFLFKLTKKAFALKEVQVEAARDEQWYVNLEVFKENFIGMSAVARQCKLLNPEVLTIMFDPQAGLLEVKAKDVLKIENPALGYTISYLLQEFKLYTHDGYTAYLGYPSFKPMAGGKGKQRRWNKQRRQAYRGSVMHFVRALRQRQLEEQGFNLRRLYRVPNPSRPSDEEIAAARAKAKASAVSGAVLKLDDTTSSVLSRASLPKLIARLDTNRVPYPAYLQEKEGQLILKFDDFFQVVYTGEMEEEAYVRQENMFRTREPGYQTSVVSLTTNQVVLDENGSFYEPLGLLFEGYWGWEKLGDMLPLDYQPEN
ncbi:carboxypeptidase-like protein [Pontibacter ummariensis]|uniref:CarboxypepD_reg-like domain-containing protein n=1 Tax=Pontibacter ummariensis TaxID=1610492 RepID=A0A239IKX5_9BACT|nr:carboxypeptidase-like regulatory domain-containing protein [Pontibacter ummariensis]PRY09877.1 carboxypeptidase-like protein [Pontibacter ummariensis]SNS93703.1 CarboxypepD_reg-like domain-containing protein [Pontibacter ummariensis]